MKDKITIELEVDAAQEVLSSIETISKRIYWVLENQPPKGVPQLALLKKRQKLINGAANQLRDAMNKRALEKQGV